MKKQNAAKPSSSSKPKISELRENFEFIKASFAIEGILFTEEELRVIESSIRKRHRGPGFLSGAKSLLTAKST